MQTTMTTTNEYWSAVVHILQSFPCSCRVKSFHDDATDWQRPVFSPVPGYIEVGSLGPVPMREVEWVEVQSTETRHPGRRVPDSLVDHSSALRARFADASLHYQTVEHGFRLLPANSE
jgi:hypothetical protein